ncbi:transposase [Streptomyces flavidovirens]|uniref:Transposase n=1 Tax=Streptomyces flavidovirens TaxID=67298 RepID=A0ABW6RN64_9ACTN
MPAGARLLADLADVTGLTRAYSTALRPLRPHGTGHGPGRIATDLAVMVADGGETITDLAVLRDQGGVFGPVASTPTTWRLLAAVDEHVLDSMRSARAQAREVAWLQASETRSGIPAAKAGGREVPGLFRDIDATLITCHSDKDQAAPTYKGGFGYHPCCVSWPTPARACSGAFSPGTPAPTPQRITSRCWTTLSYRSPTPVGTALTSLFVPTVPDPQSPSSPKSEACEHAESAPSSLSDTPSPSRSAARSGPCPSSAGTPPWTRTAPSASPPRSPN